MTMTRSRRRHGVPRDIARVCGLPLSECTDCCEPIRWVRLDSGKAIAVNPRENAAGTVAAAKVGRELHGHVISREKPAPKGALMFKPHVATCEARQPPPAPEPHPSLF